jgi:O-antigen ligase
MFFLDYQHGLNARSAHSLSIRVLSENGILGFIFYWYLILRNFFLKLTYEERAISLGCLSHFLSKTLKLGGYFDYGTPFFLMMLVVIFINAKKRTKQEFISIPKKQ